MVLGAARSPSLSPAPSLVQAAHLLGSLHAAAPQPAARLGTRSVGRPPQGLLFLPDPASSLRPVGASPSSLRAVLWTDLPMCSRRLIPSSALSFA